MPKPDRSKQKTPKGAEIPVPKRKEFYGNLDKMVKAPVASPAPAEARVLAERRARRRPSQP